MLDDIIAVYHYYCTGRIVLKPNENDGIQSVEVAGTEKYQIGVDVDLYEIWNIKNV